MINLQELTLEEKIGQMIMVGFNGNGINDKIKTLILDYKIGGVILYKKNYNSYEEMLKLIKDLKELNKSNQIPLFIAIDQEGGRVNRFPKEFLNLPSAYKLAKTGDVELVREAAKITGEILHNTGVNMNVAPVLDIKRFKDNQAIGDRAFGNDKQIVIDFGIPVMKELQYNNIVSVVKHFPGHGLTNKDSHFWLPIVKKSIKEIENDDLVPFRYAISQGVDAIMVGHMIIKDISKTIPSSLSRKFIGKYIRKKCKFHGIVVTDDLKMQAIKFIYGYKLAIKQAFQSGSDVIMFRFDFKDEKKAIKQAYNMARTNQLREKRINRSVKRILNIKYKYNISDDMVCNGVNVNEMNDRIECVRKKVEKCQSQ